MKKILIPVFLAGAMAIVNAAEKPDPDVIVFLHADDQPPAVLGFAKGEAKEMLASVGIALEFRVGNPNYHGRAEVIEAVVTTQPDEKFVPGALAFATLGKESGTRIEIFYNRISGSQRDSSAPPVLAHVLVHEITHILEGVNRHSESGVMKAHFDPEDRQQMRYAPLPFAPEDVRLIQAWSARHHQTLLAVRR